jgi:hypothetical protein
MARPDEAHLPGQAIYTRPVLAIYDLWVHGLSNPLVWRCPTRHLRRLYARHLSANHMDVGVGTGSLLDRAPFPSPAPRLALVDANEACLATAGRRLRRYRPERHRRNVLEPLGDVGPPFASIGLTYLLHCLPGDLSEKAVVFDHLNACLSADGVVFGATLMGRGVSSTRAARRLMAAYNARGIFTNADDDPRTLRAVLDARYREVDIEIVGSVALFAARGPAGGEGQDVGASS